MKRKTLPVAIALLWVSASALAQNARGEEQEDILREIAVTGSGEEGRIALREVLSPGVVSVAYPDDVKGEHKSIPDLLDQIPGVYVRRLGGSAHYTTASIRGAAPSQVNIYIDGVPLNTASETAADLSTLPIANVERVEVYRGTTPARFSGAPIGGAINIVTKKPTTFSGSVSGGRRSFGGEQYGASLNVPLLGGHLLVGLDKDRSTGDFKYTDYSVAGKRNLVWKDGTHYYDASGDHNVYPIPDGRDIPDRRKRMNDGSDKENVLLKWENRNFLLKYARTEMERYLPTGISGPLSGSLAHLQDLPWVPAVYNPRNRQQIEQQEILAGWRGSLGRLDLGFNLSWLDRDQQYRNLDIEPPASGWMGRDWTEYRTTRKGIAGDAAWSFGSGPLAHRFEVYAERYWEVLDSDMSGNNGKSDFIEEFKRIRTSLQIQDTLTIAALGDLQITPIFRVEKLDGPVIGSRWSPLAGPTGKYNWHRTGSLSVKKDFASGWQAFGNYGSYIRYPNFYEIYGNGLGTVPNVDSTGRAIQLVPETGRNGDLGFGWNGRFGEDWRGGFRLTWFQRDAKDAITLYSAPIAAKYINSGNTRTRGLELEGKLAWGRRADLQLAVTRQEGKYVGKDGYYYFGGNTPERRWPGQKVRTKNTPLLVANVRLNLHFLGGDLTTFIEGTRIGRNYLDVNTWENPLTTVNLGAHYRIAKGWKLSLGVNDVFDKGPEQTVESPENILRYHKRTCPGGGPFNNELDCSFGFVPWTEVSDEARLKRNVAWPLQGRTLWATLNYSF
ncbi:TonB-dependent receptor [Pseudothauera rhizosphaerae]|uniref:TonB-dependent receptor n=1 Tax=Pseudothauera rhizosphaerae TaxID=2565932 RepID=A0A4S4ALA5_9RHOO|nr:TonB-dependent receptor [Pseudothauera rhizosphaerae]THF60284.1 TonB-dependent receptor [Pseudothauera rhizosphaerae]